ncbi:hypothetical protein B0H10DRAFT_2439874 [Mycena sp. CBHHK59/15]|nr:hypothetical protein B0H10DRAFT_2439874 [Mycena sp. CBHHK59/15]
MSSITLRRSTVERKSGKTMYDGFVDEAKALGDTNLSAHEIDGTFMRAKPDPKGNIYYENLDGTPFPYNDSGSKSHRMILGLRCPTAALEELRTMFVNGLAVCDAIRGANETEEKANGEHFDVVEWITCGESEAVDEAVLLLRLHQTYEVPYSNIKTDSSSSPRTPRKRITKVGSSENATEKSNNLGDVDMDAAAQVTGIERQIGDTYPPDKLPDHQGPYFAHDRAKLVQRDYRDVDGSLIAPHELYEKLTEGTLVLVMISLATYVITDQKTAKGDPMADKKIYHVLVDRLKILDRGDGQAWAPAIPTMPERRYFSSGSPAKKRARDSAADAAFENFGSRAAPGPLKKAKRK